MQPTSENANSYLYCEPYQNWAKQSYNQWNEGIYRFNYSQQSRVYYSETADQYNQFENYENDYYNNDQFKHKDDWVNHIINENQTFSKTYKEPLSEFNENVDINYTVKQTFYHCCHCSESFSLNNTLHKHIRSGHSTTKVKWDLTSESELKSVYSTTSNKELVQSNITNISARGYRFQEWCYVTVQARLSQEGLTVFICLNTDCTASLIDWDFFNEHISQVEVKKMASSMKVWELSSSSHAAEDYVKLNLYLSADHSKTAVIHCEIYVIDDLKVNICIRTNILVSEQINVLLSQQKAVIESCENV